MPKLYIIAGCNGAGKTTASYTVLPEMLGCKEFVNADEIAKGLSPFNPESVAIEAGRLMLQRMDDLLSEGSDFAFWNDIVHAFLCKVHRTGTSKGYFVTLLYFLVADPRTGYRTRRDPCARGRPQYSFGCDSSPLCQWDKEFDRSFIFPLCNYWGDLRQQFGWRADQNHRIGRKMT